MAIETLDDLFVHELRETYYLEEELVRPLREMASGTTNATIARGFSNHVDETKDHVERLRGSFSALELPPEGIENPAFDGLMERRRRLEDETATGELLDVFYLAVGAEIERMEITRYEELLLLGEKLGFGSDVTDPFQENMQEERKTLAELEALGAASELKTLWRNLTR